MRKRLGWPSSADEGQSAGWDLRPFQTDGLKP